MVLECENYNDVEIIVGTYEEFVLGYKALKAEDGVSLTLLQSPPPLVKLYINNCCFAEGKPFAKLRQPRSQGERAMRGQRRQVHGLGRCRRQHPALRHETEEGDGRSHAS
jgi:hypothetical protein